jgi:hypothetical protein
VTRRLAATTLVAALGLLALAPAALANHGHVLSIGDGRCVLLAANGGEDEVVLPLSVFEHNPNVDIAPGADRMHPLHVLVHQGVPGEHLGIAVAGTTAAAALCPNGIVND